MALSFRLILLCFFCGMQAGSATAPYEFVIVPGGLPSRGRSCIGGFDDLDFRARQAVLIVDELVKLATRGVEPGAGGWIGPVASWRR
ncbi:MAG TPA: hypothetical protein VMF69_11910 [Gemmataceae bacterium]|nr:hypothetical protein [Gemmataceae bacterium]